MILKLPPAVGAGATKVGAMRAAASMPALRPGRGAGLLGREAVAGQLFKGNEALDLLLHRRDALDGTGLVSLEPFELGPDTRGFQSQPLRVGR